MCFMPLKNRVMEIAYERKHNESYMLLEGKINPNFYETKMINENNISTFLPMSCIAIDGINKLSYKISRKENLEDFIESHDLNLDMLTRIIINLQIALNEIARYLIDEQHVLLNKETIFMEKSGDSYKISLCYYPQKSGTVQEQFRELMEYFISKLTTGDRNESKQVYLAYDLCLKDDYTLEEVLDCLQEVETKDEIYVEKVSLDDEDDRPEEPQNYDYIDSGYMTDYYDEKPKEKKRLFGKVRESMGIFFGNLRFRDEVDVKESDDFIIEPDIDLEERTVLLSEAKAVGRLVYDGNSNEDDFIINKDIFKIGTAKNNDAVLKARTVSGSHAKITREGSDYYITDSNSLNGSFLNSLPLAYRKPYKLHPMDVIKFASESYIFM